MAITFHRKLEKSKIHLEGPVGSIQIDIRSRLSNRQRREVGRTFLRQIRPWLKYFNSTILFHDPGSLPWFERLESRGVPIFNSKNLDTESGRFGFLIRMSRLESGMTQEELAMRAGISPTHLSDIERGLHLPVRGTQKRLVEALARVQPKFRSRPKSADTSRDNAHPGQAASRHGASAAG